MLFLSEKSNGKPSGITPPSELLLIFFLASTNTEFYPKNVLELLINKFSKSVSILYCFSEYLIPF